MTKEAESENKEATATESNADSELCQKCGKAIFKPSDGSAPAPRLSMDEECCCEPEGIKLGDGLFDGDDITRTRQIPAQEAPEGGIKLGGDLWDSAEDDDITATRQMPEEKLVVSKSSTNIPANAAAKLRKLRRTHAGITFTPTDKGGAKPGTVGLMDGATIGGVYRIIKKVGSGAMGDVYLAEHVMLGTKCAIKVIPPEHVTQMSWQRFQTEAKAVAMLDHVNLVKVSDLGVHAGCLPFYAMQFLEGDTLEDVLAGQRRLPLKTVLDIFIPLCDALEYAHKHNVVHRDLKPANIMLLSGPISKDSIKLLDFGLAKLMQPEKGKKNLTSIGEIWGSPPYMSPEQCRGDDIDSRSDIYSLGCTLFECLTGRPPFDATLFTTLLYNHQNTKPPSLASAVGSKAFPDAMEMVVEKLLRKDQLERYQSMLEVRRDLELISVGENPASAGDPQAASGIMNMRASQAKMPAVDPLQTRMPSLGASQSRLPAITDEELAKDQSSSSRLRQLANVSSGRTKMQAVEIEDEDDEVDDDEVAPRRLNPYDDPDVWVIRKPPKIVMVLTGLLVTGMAAAYIFYAVHKEMQAPVAPVISMDSQPLSVKENLPFSATVDEGGKTYRRFNFPLDMSLGQIHSAANLVVVPAMGQIQYAESDPVYFVPDKLVANYPGYMTRFRPGDIVALSIPDVPNCDAVIKACSAIPGVQRLTIYRCHSLTPAGLEALTGYSTLEELGCSYNKIDVSPIASYPGLKVLKSLRLSGSQNTDAVIEKLAGSDAIKELYLDDCTVGETTLANIASLPNLTTLSLNSDNLTDADLTTLSKCPKLHFLSMINTPVTAETANILKTFPGLKTVHIATKGASAEGESPLTGLRNALPDLQVF